MARILYLFLAASFVGLMAYFLWPQKTPKELTAAQIQSYARFVEQHTTYGRVAPPAVRIVGKAEFNAVRDSSGIYYLGYGAYRDDAIWLDATRFALSDDLSRSALVNLLVYHAQETWLKTDRWGPVVLNQDLYQRLGLDQRCKEPRVWEAFTVQNRWLQGQGQGFQVKPDVMNKMSRCELD